MERFIIKLIIKIGLRNKQKFLRTIAKLEYGVAIFCKKLACIATEEGKTNLGRMLNDHAADEERHGKMLACLADGQDRVTLEEETGRWVSLVRPSGENIARYKNPESSVETKEIVFQSVKFENEELAGKFENLDGLSKRYFSLRLLFGNRSAADFSWCDRLAFMCSLEKSTQQFYEILSELVDEQSLKLIALKIAKDEIEHSSYLEHVLAQFSPVPKSDIQKWQFRLFYSLCGLLFDIRRIL